jgi:quercetin dioxygenase-like cupin family protein
MKKLESLAEFRRQLDNQGYSKPETQEFEENYSCEIHAHAFSVFALVEEGEFILHTEKNSEAFHPGDTCNVTAGKLHAEGSGPDGAKIIFGKKFI